jgi:hypothetical protein
MKKIRRGAIGAGLTWVVATITIFFVILVFLIASGALKIGNIKSFVGRRAKPLMFPEQQQSLIAISKTPGIRNAIVAGQYPAAETSLTSVIKKLNPDAFSGWGLYVYENNNAIIKVRTYSFWPGMYDEQNFYVVFEEGRDKFDLAFFLESENAEYADFG